MAVMKHRFMMSWGRESSGRPVMKTGWLWVVDQCLTEIKTALKNMTISGEDR